MAAQNQKLAPGVDAATRERLWQLGYEADKALIYEFARYGSGPYLTCLQREMTRFVNGTSQVFLRDKLVFHQSLQGRLPVAELLAVAHRWRGDTLCRGWHELLPGPELQPIYCKPQHSGLGKGILKGLIGRNQVIVSGKSHTQEQFFSGLHRCGDAFGSPWYLVTRGLPQHELLSGFWPDSVNTVRLLCLREPQTDLRYPVAAILRVGTSQSAGLDNFSQGGTAFAIELASGTIGEGRHCLPDGSLQRITHHPDSGQPISGRVIPHWPAVLALGLDAMRALDPLVYVGWDVAIGPEGPALIEGNDYPGVRIHQVFAPLLLDERLRRFYEYYGLLAISPGLAEAIEKARQSRAASPGADSPP